MPIHIRAHANDYAPAVLVPGDPRRATYIAETFFDPGARLVNTERGELGYTGTFKGRPISVQAAGMGCASAAIYYSELIQLGATRLIRVGTAGGLADGLRMEQFTNRLLQQTEDVQEGRAAFAEKRKPNFKGR